MAGRKEYELLFKLQAALGGNFNTVFQSALNTTKQMQNSLTKLNSITGKIDAYKKQEAALESNRQKLERLTAEHDKLQREMSETAAPSEELRQKMAKNEKQIAATTAKIEAQEQRLQTLGSELSDVGVNTANLSAENERLAKTYDKVKKSQEEIAKVNTALEQNNTSISNTKTQLAGVIGTAAALGAAIYAGPVKKSRELEAQMSTVKAISNATTEDMTRLTDMAKHMGATTQFTAVEAGKALEYMAIGVYIGGGKVIECSPAFKNCVQVTACLNIGAISGMNGRKWTKHGKLPYITYDTAGGAQDGAGSTTKPSGTTTTPATLAFAVGDVVRFTGNTHYTNAAAASGAACKPGTAKVTALAKGAKHPYHLIKQPGGGSTVYGWVNAADVQAVGSGTTAPKMRVGAKVKYSGPLYRDSNGGGKGKTVNGTYTVKYYYTGRKCGVHIDGLGWVPESGCTVIG